MFGEPRAATSNPDFARGATAGKPSPDFEVIPMVEAVDVYGKSRLAGTGALAIDAWLQSSRAVALPPFS